MPIIDNSFNCFYCRKEILPEDLSILESKNKNTQTLLIDGEYYTRESYFASSSIDFCHAECAKTEIKNGFVKSDNNPISLYKRLVALKKTDLN